MSPKHQHISPSVLILTTCSQTNCGRSFLLVYMLQFHQLQTVYLNTNEAKLYCTMRKRYYEVGIY